MAVELVGAGFSLEEVRRLDLVSFGAAGRNMRRIQIRRAREAGNNARAAFHADQKAWKDYSKQWDLGGPKRGPDDLERDMAEGLIL